MAGTVLEADYAVIESTGTPCVPDPTFNEVMPPQMCSRDALPPERSTAHIIGKLEITPADFERVVDPDYPWQKYQDYKSNPDAYAEMARIKKQQVDEVERYVVTRSRYWLRQDPIQYPDETSVTITTHHGLTTHHGQTQDMTITQTISIGLGLNFTAPLGGGEPVPPPAMARAAAAPEDAGGGDGDGASGSSGLHFSYDFSQTLHISQTDDATYMDERTEQVQVTYFGGFLYVPWDLAEDLVLERQKKKEDLKERTRMSGITKRKWTQKFPIGEAAP